MRMRRRFPLNFETSPFEQIALRELEKARQAEGEKITPAQWDRTAGRCATVITQELKVCGVGQRPAGENTLSLRKI
jgi:hypothetical protein